MTRAEVRESQRARMVRGMAEVVAEKGLAKATVADVIKRVRVSRETFYQNFADKGACFLAVVDECAGEFAGVLESEFEGDGLDGFGRGISAYLERLAAEPAMAKVFFVEVYAAGQAAVEKRLELQERFAEVAERIFDGEPRWRALPDRRFAARALVAAVTSLITTTAAAGQAKRLPELRDEIMELLEHLLRG